MWTRLTAAAVSAVACVLVSTSPAGADITGWTVTEQNNYFGGDRPDLVALPGDGTLLIYSGEAAPSRLVGPVVLATGLRGFDWAQFAGDVNDDGMVDVLTRSGSGDLWLLTRKGAYTPVVAERIGTGWGAFEELVPVDADTDGQMDLLALDRDTGLLWSYRGLQGSGFARPFVLATKAHGWDEMSAVGDMDSDGYQELIVRLTATGELLSLELEHDGTIARRPQHRLIGTGWQAFTAIHSPGDLTGDGKPDVLARTALGTLWLYQGKGAGLRGVGTPLGRGWANLTFG